VFPFRLERGKVTGISGIAERRMAAFLSAFFEIFDIVNRFPSVLPKSSKDEERYGFRCAIVKHLSLNGRAGLVASKSERSLRYRTRNTLKILSLEGGHRAARKTSTRGKPIVGLFNRGSSSIIPAGKPSNPSFPIPFTWAHGLTFSWTGKWRLEGARSWKTSLPPL